MDSQTQLKIDNEEKFKPEVLALFNRIRAEYRAAVAAGVTLRADKYDAQVQAMLEQHYRRVQKAFRGEAGVDIQDENAVFSALILWAVTNARDSVAYFVSTTQDNMDGALRYARQAMSDAGMTDLTDRDTAAVMDVMLARIFAGRVSTVAVVETQKSAESTKLIEAYDSAGLDPLGVVDGSSVIGVTHTKEWVTVGDSRVRPAHRIADGQTRVITDPFNVMGQKLMYPGDTSLGATMENIVNCRCSAVYKEGA